MDSWQDYVVLDSNEHKNILSISIRKPIKLYVHCFVFALYNCVSDDAVGNTVVKLSWFWILNGAHLMEIITKGHSIFAVDKTWASFIFLNGGYDSVDAFTVD